MVGVTGSPGAGKSTLIDGLISRYRKVGATVGVLVVDPSSPFTNGALLGDRVRMQDHVSDPGVYVRSMATRGHLGGVADTTAKVVTLLDAVGFDLIVVETVGVGQNEVEVAEMADTTLVVLTPGSGDDIQAAKAGLLEVGDIFCVNKADLSGADDIVRHLTQMLELGPDTGWKPPIITTCARTGEGVDRLRAAIEEHRKDLGGLLGEDRASRLETILRRAMSAAISAKTVGAPLPADEVGLVTARQVDPWTVARRLIG